jgi:hypothetical protein
MRIEETTFGHRTASDDQPFRRPGHEAKIGKGSDANARRVESHIRKTFREELSQASW